MAKKKPVEAIEPETTEETPVEQPLQGRLSKSDMAHKNADRLVVQAEARKSAKERLRSEWEAKLEASIKQNAIDSPFLGKFFAFKEKNGSVCPAIFVGEREQHKKIDGVHQYDANGHQVMEFVAIVYVFSATTSQPYKADYEI